MTSPADLVQPFAKAAHEVGYTLVRVKCDKTGGVAFYLKRDKKHVAAEQEAVAISADLVNMSE